MLILIRHGKPEIKEKCFLGHTEVPLSEIGKGQMRQAGLLCSVLPEKLWVSTSIRCRESADVFLEQMKMRCPGYEPEIQYMEELREINLGIWDGRSFEEIQQEYPSEYKERGENLASYCVQGGESFQEVQNRSVGALKQILQEPEKNHVLITHLGVMRTLKCWIEKIPLEQLMQQKWNYGELFVLSNQEIGRILAETNGFRHELQ